METTKLHLNSTTKKARERAADLARWRAVVEVAGAAKQDAVPLLLHGIELLADNDAARAEIWALLAEVEGEAQRWRECIAACDEALQIAPRHHAALEMRAAALLHSGDIEGSAATLEKLLRVSPRDPLHRLKYATLLQLKDETARAAQEFERVLRSHPDAPFAEEAHAALELLDNIQGHHAMMRAGIDIEFRRALETDVDAALESGGLYLSETARESLRQNLADGRVQQEKKIFVH